MMKTLRQGVSGWIAKLLLGLVVLAFVVTGFSGFFQSGAATDVVRAGDTTVDIADYHLVYRLAENSLEQRLQRLLSRDEARSSGVDGQVLGQLVSSAVLVEQARRIGLGLSDDHLGATITRMPEFAGRSGPEIRQILARAGYNDEQFIRYMKRQAVRGQIEAAVADGVAAPQVLRSALGLYGGERRTVEFVTYAPSLVEPIADPDASALQAFFDKNKARYAAPEYRKLAYATLTPEAIADPAAVTADAIKADYDRNPQRFATPELRRIEQLVLSDKAAADTAKAAIDAGKTFEQAVTDSGRTLADAQLGLLAESDVSDPKIAEAAFALAAGQVSGVVEGAFGPVLVRVTEVQPGARKPLDAVSEDIRRELALETATGAVQQSYNAFEDARAGGATLEEAAAREGLTVRTVAAVDAQGRQPDGQPVTDLPDADALIEAAFAADPGVEALPLDLPSGGHLFYDVVSVDPARDRTLDEVRARAVADWKAEETQRLLSERVEADRKRAEGGTSLDQIAAEAKSVKTLNAGITRRSGVGEIGAAATTAAFSGPTGLLAAAKAADGTAQMLLRVTQVSAPIDPLAEVGPAESDRIGAGLQNDLVASYIGRVRDDVTVTSSPAAIEQAQATLR